MDAKNRYCFRVSNPDPYKDVDPALVMLDEGNKTILKVGMGWIPSAVEPLRGYAKVKANGVPLFATPSGFGRAAELQKFIRVNDFRTLIVYFDGHLHTAKYHTYQQQTMQPPADSLAFHPAKLRLQVVDVGEVAIGKESRFIMQSNKLQQSNIKQLLF